MKRFVSVILSLAMLLSLTAVTASAAVSVKAGDIYSASGSSVDEDLDNVAAPGRTVYVALREYDADDKVEKAKITADDSDSKTLVANSSKLSIVRLKVSGGERWYFAALPIKEISASKYDEDGPYDYDGTIEVTGSDTDEEISVSFSIEYEEQDSYRGTFYDYPSYFTYEKDDDIDISDEDNKFNLEGTATGTGKVVAYVDTDTIDAVEDKYGDKANMVYYSCKGDFTRIKNSVLTIDADPGKYLYEYSNGKLTDLSDTYDKQDEEFHIKGTNSSFTLGTYVVSDTKLSGSAVSSSSSAASSTTPSGTNTSTAPMNPNTGAAL